MLALVQRGLEHLYRIKTDVDVTDYVIDERARREIGVTRAPREQLLVSETQGDLELALFVDADVLAHLATNDPRTCLDDTNLHDFLLTVEGVSHFVCVVWRARGGRPISALELELQAEVDKYVTCLLTMWPQQGSPPADLRERLFERFELAPGLVPEERERYLFANANARSYAASLEARFVATSSVAEMLAELRRFYRLGVQEKLAYIAQAA